MSRSQHPVALRLERLVGGDTRLLATVMALPLVDGIFAALVLAGILETVGGVFQVGLLVISGSATVAVVLAEIDDPRANLGNIAGIGVIIVVLAAVEAAVAPTIGGLVDLAIFERFAALVILAVAAKTASARVGEYLPRPAVIIAFGAVASVDPAGATLAVTLDPGLIVRAAAAAGVGVSFTLLVAALAPTLRRVVDLDRFRFGSAVALGTLPLSLLEIVPGNAPLAVLAVAALLAFDPDAVDETAGAPTAAADGGADGDSVTADGDDSDEPPVEDRAPWV